jgi:hypothetical protein
MGRSNMEREAEQTYAIETMRKGLSFLVSKPENCFGLYERCPEIFDDLTKRHVYMSVWLNPIIAQDIYLENRRRQELFESLKRDDLCFMGKQLSFIIPLLKHCIVDEQVMERIAFIRDVADNILTTVENMMEIDEAIEDLGISLCMRPTTPLFFCNHGLDLEKALFESLDSQERLREICHRLTECIIEERCTIDILTILCGQKDESIFIDHERLSKCVEDMFIRTWIVPMREHLKSSYIEDAKKRLVDLLTKL